LQTYLQYDKNNVGFKRKIFPGNMEEAVWGGNLSGGQKRKGVFYQLKTLSDINKS